MFPGTREALDPVWPSPSFLDFKILDKGLIVHKQCSTNPKDFPQPAGIFRKERRKEKWNFIGPHSLLLLTHTDLSLFQPPTGSLVNATTWKSCMMKWKKSRGLFGPHSAPLKSKKSVHYLQRVLHQAWGKHGMILPELHWLISCVFGFSRYFLS